MARVVARASVVASSRPRAREGRARDAHRASSPWAATGVSTVDLMTTRENDARAFFSRGGARGVARAIFSRATRSRAARAGRGTRERTGTGRGGCAGAAAAAAAAAASDETTMKPTVVWMTTTTVRRTIERAPRALVLALAAGVWAQSVNLGGTLSWRCFACRDAGGGGDVRARCGRLEVCVLDVRANRGVARDGDVERGIEIDAIRVLGRRVGSVEGVERRAEIRRRLGFSTHALHRVEFFDHDSDTISRIDPIVRLRRGGAGDTDGRRRQGGRGAAVRKSSCTGIASCS